MHVEVKDSFETNEEGLPATIDFSFSFDHDAETLPLRAVMQALARHLASGAVHPVEVTLASATGLEEAPAAQGSEARPGWQRPKDLHGKALKTVHRVVVELDKAGRKGLTVQDIHQRTGVSLVPLYNVLKDDAPQGRYASKYIRATKVGRRQVLDLNPEGRYLASLIRAERVPA